MNGGDVIRWSWRILQLILEASLLLESVRVLVNWRGAASALRDARLLEPWREKWGLDETWWRLVGLACAGMGVFALSRSLGLSAPSGPALELAGIGIYVAGLCGAVLRTGAAVRTRRRRPEGLAWG